VTGGNSTVSEFIQELARLPVPNQPTKTSRRKTLWVGNVIFNNIIQGFEVAEKFYETDKDVPSRTCLPGFTSARGYI
jgi:hypothetical protein